MKLLINLKQGKFNEYLTLVLDYQTANRGIWRLEGTYVNLLAFERTGNFAQMPYGGVSTIACYDGVSDDYAFALMYAPTGQWDKTHTQGTVSIEHPRNPAGHNLHQATWEQFVGDLLP